MAGALRKAWTSLSGKRDFDRVFGEGRRVGGRYFTLFLLVTAAGEGPRLGLVVSKKAARAATRRNMIKRIVRESFRHNTALRRPGVELVVLARPGLADVRREDLRQAIDRQLERAAGLFAAPEGEG